jgi:hypothetical protein
MVDFRSLTQIRAEISKRTRRVLNLSRQGNPPAATTPHAAPLLAPPNAALTKSHITPEKHPVAVAPPSNSNPAPRQDPARLDGAVFCIMDPVAVEANPASWKSTLTFCALSTALDDKLGVDVVGVTDAQKQLVAARLRGSMDGANMRHFVEFFSFHNNLPYFYHQSPSHLDRETVLADLQKLARPLIIATVYINGWHVSKGVHGNLSLLLQHAVSGHGLLGENKPVSLAARLIMVRQYWTPSSSTAPSSARRSVDSPLTTWTSSDSIFS